MEVVYVKLGGSFLTLKNRPASVNYDALRATLEIFAEVQKRGVDLLAGNGGGSFAHYVVLKYRERDYRDLLVSCHKATRLLNRLLVDYLVENGIRATSIQTSAILSYDPSSNSFKVYAEPIKVLIENKIIPVVYGECVLRGNSTIAVSTEQVFELLAEVIRPKRIVLLTDVGGVYTCDPKKCTSATLINKITRDNVNEVLSFLRSSGGMDVTGGMYEKVRVVSELAFKLRAEAIITSGFDVESAVAAITGGYPERATLITP